MAFLGQAHAALIADRRRDLAWSAAAALAAVPLMIWMRGFTIDDALISIRYARHVAGGAGYRFNVDGPSTDGVTPLPWAFVLGLFARGGAWAVLGRARWLGAGVWLVAAAGWGRAVGRAPAPAWAKGAALALLAVCLPVAAHAVSGMETSVAMALATAAAVETNPWVVCATAGLVGSLRPEMVVWSVVLAIGAGPPRRAPLRVLVAASPFVLCAAIRLAVFGHAGPLALLAKPSDLDHGLTYAGAAALVALAPLAVFAPMALARARDRSTTLALAGLSHFAAIALAGGDWMPYARLAAPIVPSLLYAFVLASPRMSRTCAGVRVVIAGGLAVYLLIVAAPAGRHVGPNVEALVARARPWLVDAKVVAALDVGWPTAATEATIVDLAGLTDPEIAALPGGHTSKRVDPAFLLARDPDVLLFYARRQPGSDQPQFTRVVEARLAGSDLIGQKYETRAFLPYGEDGAGYVVMKRRESTKD